MSNNLDEYRVPVPEGSEPEEPPPKSGSRIVLILSALALLLAIGIFVVFFLRNDDNQGLRAEENDSNSTIPTQNRVQTSVATPTPVQPLPQEGRIVFIDEESRLVTINPDGSEQRILTELGKFYQFPAWSPIDNSIAAIGSDFEGAGVYTIEDATDAALHQLYANQEDVPIYLFWSPDGEDVSFIAHHPDGLALHLVPSDGTSGSKIQALGVGSFFWNWTPDSQEMLIHTGFTNSNTDQSQLAYVPTGDGADIREIQENGFFQTPGISFDGTFYSFGDSDPVGNRWLIIWNEQRDQQERLLNHQGVVAMGWNPTGDVLAYTSPPSQANTFYGPLNLINIEEEATRQLITEQVLAFFWSPDGKSIAYFTLAGIEETDSDQTSESRYRDTLQFMNWVGSESSKQPIWQRSQTQPRRRVFLNLALVEVESGNTIELLTFEPSYVFLNQFLPFFDQYALSHSLWSVDSSSLVLPLINEEEESVVVIVPTDGSKARVIANGDIAFWSHLR